MPLCMGHRGMIVWVCGMLYRRDSRHIGFCTCEQVDGWVQVSGRGAVYVGGGCLDGCMGGFRGEQDNKWGWGQKWTGKQVSGLVVTQGHALVGRRIGGPVGMHVAGSFDG